MAIINFPDSPVVDQVFTQGSRSWKWNGSFWAAVNISGSAIITQQDTAPSNPGVGDLWYDTANGVLLLYYSDNVGTPQWVDVAGSPVVAEAIDIGLQTPQSVESAMTNDGLYTWVEDEPYTNKALPMLSYKSDRGVFHIGGVLHDASFIVGDQPGDDFAHPLEVEKYLSHFRIAHSPAGNTEPTSEVQVYIRPGTYVFTPYDRGDGIGLQRNGLRGHQDFAINYQALTGVTAPDYTEFTGSSATDLQMLKDHYTVHFVASGGMDSLVFGDPGMGMSFSDILLYPAPDNNRNSAIGVRWELGSFIDLFDVSVIGFGDNFLFPVTDNVRLIRCIGAYGYYHDFKFASATADLRDCLSVGGRHSITADEGSLITYSNVFRSLSCDQYTYAKADGQLVTGIGRAAINLDDGSTFAPSRQQTSNSIVIDYPNDGIWVNESLASIQNISMTNVQNVYACHALGRSFVKFLTPDTITAAPGAGLIEAATGSFINFKGGNSTSITASLSSNIPYDTLDRYGSIIAVEPNESAGSIINTGSVAYAPKTVDVTSGTIGLTQQDPGIGTTTYTYYLSDFASSDPEFDYTRVSGIYINALTKVSAPGTSNLFNVIAVSFPGSIGYVNISQIYHSVDTQTVFYGGLTKIPINPGQQLFDIRFTIEDIDPAVYARSIIHALETY